LEPALIVEEVLGGLYVAHFGSSHPTAAVEAAECFPLVAEAAELVVVELRWRRHLHSAVRPCGIRSYYTFLHWDLKMKVILINYHPIHHCID
jgi:hypothetical protein